MIKYIEKGEGLSNYLASFGIELAEVYNGGIAVWQSNVSDDLVNAKIQEYNPWTIEKAHKYAEIDAAFQQAVDNLTAGWPEGEIKTWSKQESEALALQANPAAITPTLSMIAAQRGITVAELANRVLRDATAFSQASGYYVGLRHKARQKVQSLPNEGSYERLQELQAIKFGG